MTKVIDHHNKYSRGVPATIFGTKLQKDAENISVRVQDAHQINVVPVLDVEHEIWKIAQGAYTQIGNAQVLSESRRTGARHFLNPHNCPFGFCNETAGSRYAFTGIMPCRIFEILFCLRMPPHFFHVRDRRRA